MRPSGSRKLTEIKIELTQECPLACIHCSTGSNRFARSLLPLEVVIRLLNQARQLGATKVAITGGEPLVYSGLNEVLGEAASLGLTASLYTTGVRNNDLEPLRRIDARNLKEAGLSRVIFSLYAANPEGHNAVTGFPSFQPTVAAVKTCLDEGIPVEFHFVPLCRNYLELGKLVRLAEGLGVRRLSILRFVPHGRGAAIKHAEDLHGEQLRELAAMISALRGRSSVQIRLGAPMNVLRLGHTCCDAAQDIVVIDHRGRVFPCDGFKASDYPDPVYGSVLHNSLQRVWDGSTYLDAARYLHAERRRACGNCPSSCMAQEAFHNGGLQRLVQLSVGASRDSASRGTQSTSVAVASRT